MKYLKNENPLRIFDAHLEDRIISCNGVNVKKTYIDDELILNEDYDKYTIVDETNNKEKYKGFNKILNNNLKPKTDWVISYFKNVFICIYPGIDGVVFLQNSKFIKEQLHFAKTRFMNDLVFRYMTSPDQVKTLENAFIPFDSGVGNFYHYLVLCLPKIYIKNQIKALNRFQTYLPAFKNWELNKKIKQNFSEHTYNRAPEVLNLNSSSINHLESGIYFVKELALLNSRIFPRHDLVFSKKILECFNNANYIHSDIGLDKNVFLSRKNSRNKRPIDKIESTIISDQSKKVEKIVPDQLSLDEQISLFNNANEISSLHGAALTNLLFVKHQNLTVNEYASFPKNQVSNVLLPHFMNIAKAKNLSYNYFFVNL